MSSCPKAGRRTSPNRRERGGVKAALILDDSMRRRPKRSSGVLSSRAAKTTRPSSEKVSAWFSSVPIQRRPVLFCSPR